MSMSPESESSPGSDQGGNDIFCFERVETQNGFNLYPRALDPALLTAQTREIIPTLPQGLRLLRQPERRTYLDLVVEQQEDGQYAAALSFSEMEAAEGSGDQAAARTMSTEVVHVPRSSDKGVAIVGLCAIRALMTTQPSGYSGLPPYQIGQ